MLKLNAASVNLYNTLRGEMVETYTHLASEDASEVMSFYSHYRKLIQELDSSNDEPNEDEIDAGHASILMNLNVKLQREALQRLAQSHSLDTIESSNTTTHTTEVITMSNATINIEAMTINELAALQLKIAQRMSELLAAPSVEVVEVEPTPTPEVEVPKAESKPKATRVKKTCSKAEQATTTKTVEPALPDAASPKCEDVSNNPATDVSKMAYKDLQKFISNATKSSGKAKEIAQKVAREYGAKSWSTTGRKGYEQIYKLITA